MATVKVFGRQTENFKPGWQPEAYEHLVATFIAFVHNFSIFNQIRTLWSFGLNLDRSKFFPLEM
jgi:hypothetical protein